MQIRKGLWSPEEDDRLRRSIAKYVNGSWNDIARKAGLERCGRSCRQRWLNHLRPGLRKEKFSREEVREVIELQSKLGNRWSEIAAQLKGRTDNEVKNLWNTVLKRRLCLKGPHPYPERCSPSPAFHNTHDPSLPLVSADSPSHTSSSSQSASSSHSTSSCSLLHVGRGAPASAGCSSMFAPAMTSLDVEDLNSLNVPASERQLLMTNGPDHLMISPVDGLTCAVQKGPDCLVVDQDATSHGSSTQTPEISHAPSCGTRSEDIGVQLIKEKSWHPASSLASFELYGSLPNYCLHVTNNDVSDHDHSAHDLLAQSSALISADQTLEIDPHYWDYAVRFVDVDVNARTPVYCADHSSPNVQYIRTSLPSQSLQAAADTNCTTYNMAPHTTPIFAHKPTVPNSKVAKFRTDSGASIPASVELAPPHKNGNCHSYLRSSLFPQQAATYMQINEEEGYSQYSPTLCLPSCDGDPSYGLSSDSDYTINAYDTFAPTSPFLQTASSDDHRRSDYTAARQDGIAMSVLWNEGCSLQSILHSQI